MSLEQIQRTLLQLPRAERRRFAGWFYQHEDEIFEPRDADEINPDAKAEILHRGKEINANPGLAIPVTSQWFEELKHKLAGANPS